ncbi:hypothetical protein FBU30_000716 [Linnemannia zychae]|nr:hypothetical protein FBU30_000716 [Linnemannia zychae]
MALSGQRFEYGSIQRKLEIVASRNPDEYGFIYIDDVLRAFDIPYAGRFEANGMTLSSMRNDRGDLYYEKEKGGCQLGYLLKMQSFMRCTTQKEYHAAPIV